MAEVFSRYSRRQRVDGKEITMQVKPGDKVILPKYAGNEIKLDGKELIIVRQSGHKHRGIKIFQRFVWEAIMAKQIQYGEEAPFSGSGHQCAC